jgi:hypothetical protein
MGEDKVSSFARLVAGEAGFESCLGQVRFAILIELSETPACGSPKLDRRDKRS